MSTLTSFMFHDIRTENIYPKRYNLKSFMTQEKFKKCISLINNNYQIIGSDQIKNIDLSDGNNNFAVLTFDDGLRDHYWVSKFLKSIGLTGTFFIPKMPIHELKVIKSHKIQFILASFPEKDIVKEILGLFNSEESSDLWDMYSKTLWKNNWWSKEMIFITNFLRKDLRAKDMGITDLLFKKYVSVDEESFSKDLYLDIKNIEEMSNNGMIIGGHGNISENMILMKSDEYKQELKESFNFISNWSDDAFISYPNGGYNDEILDHTNEVGFSLGFTTVKQTLTNLDNLNYLELPRYDGAQDVL